jgi:hypothetical protein
MTLTGVTLLVTSLLVASPILFLISAAPSLPQRDGCVTHTSDCMVDIPPPECQEQICKSTASKIQARMNWKIDACKDFTSYSCSSQPSSLRIMKSPQESADHQMLRKFSLFVTMELFLGSRYQKRKLFIETKFPLKLNLTNIHRF